MPQSLNYQTPSRKRRLTVTRPIVAAALVSGAFGLLWEILVCMLLRGPREDYLSPQFMIAGLLSGIGTGLFTLWTRFQTDGHESLLWTVVTYYVGIILFGGALLVIGAADSLREQSFFWFWAKVSYGARILVGMLLYGTFPLVIVLVPACLLTRILVWRVYRSF
jgi:hypothetical protein